MIRKKIIEEWFGLPFSKKASDMNCDFKGLSDSMIEPGVGNGIRMLLLIEVTEKYLHQ